MQAVRMAAGRNEEQKVRTMPVSTVQKNEDGSKQKLRTGSANSSRMNHANSEDGGRQNEGHGSEDSDRKNN